MGKPSIPIEIASALKASGKTWKEVGRDLVKLGYPAYQPDSLSQACADRELTLARKAYQAERRPPVNEINKLRAAGVSWKRLPLELHKLGYPLWHYSTLCNAVRQANDISS